MATLPPLRVFVSHSHSDNAFCRAFVNTLRLHGIDVWYDEHNLGAGALRKAIDAEMASREHFLVILSPAALDSDWVNAEVDGALELLRERKLKTFLPIIAERCSIPPTLRGYKRIAAPDGGPLGVEEAAARALLALGASPAPMASSARDSVSVPIVPAPNDTREPLSPHEVHSDASGMSRVPSADNAQRSARGVLAAGDLRRGVAIAVAALTVLSLVALLGLHLPAGSRGSPGGALPLATDTDQAGGSTPPSSATVSPGGVATATSGPGGGSGGGSGGGPGATPSPTAIPTLTNTPFVPQYSIVERVTSGSVPAGFGNDVQAPCQSGEQLISGGYTLPLVAGNLRVNENSQAYGKWNVAVNSHISSNATLNVYAYCLTSNFNPFIYFDNGTAVTIPAGTTATATASCQSGYVRVGGGFSAGNSLVYSSIPQSNGWSAAFYELPGTGTTSASAWAVCAWGLHMSAASTPTSSFDVPPSGSQSGFVTSCPAGQTLTGGGFDTTAAAAAANINVLAVGDSNDGQPLSRWGASVYNNDGSTTYPVTVYGVCTRFQ